MLFLSSQLIKMFNFPRVGQSKPKVYVRPQRERYNRNPVQKWIQQFKRFIENYRRHIICVVITYGITVGLALERCYCKCAFIFSSLNVVLHIFKAIE